MKIYTTSTFKILALKNGKYEALTKKEVSGLCVGGFTFIIDGKEIPFDFDAFSCSEKNGIFHYESGYGFCFNDFEISDCYDYDLEKIGLSRSDLTPSFLSSASEINDFHLNFFVTENGKEEEVDIGDADENIRSDVPFKIKLLDVCFSRDEEQYLPVKEEVIQKFNGTEDDIVTNVRLAKALSEGTPNGYIVDADTILHDIMSEADFEISGISSELFSTFLEASEEGKEIVKKMFYLFTDLDFEEYVKMCIEKTTKK